MERTYLDHLDELTGRILREASSMSVFCRAHPLEAVRPMLARMGIITARDLRRVKAGEIVLVTGILVILLTPPTKSGKQVMFITMEDETGLLDVVAFPKMLDKYAGIILTSEVLTAKGRPQRRGSWGKALRIVMDRVMLKWRGRL
ncbi:MAG: OB-fold nucleic acid binding domain-containing protein [Desulfomonilaceae bacterium]